MLEESRNDFNLQVAPAQNIDINKPQEQYSYSKCNIGDLFRWLKAKEYDCDTSFKDKSYNKPVQILMFRQQWNDLS